MQDDNHILRDVIDRKTGIIYAFGHVIVDLLGAFWVTFGLYYMNTVVKMPPAKSKYIMLSG